MAVRVRVSSEAPKECNCTAVAFFVFFAKNLDTKVASIIFAEKKEL